jgi:hypothetical protein
MGTFVSRLVPSRRGPRQQGQFSAEAGEERLDASEKAASKTRNPKPETRKKAEIRNPKAATTHGNRLAGLIDS